VPWSLIHDDVSVAVACAHGWKPLGVRQLVGNSTAIQGPTPILFGDPDFVRLRHDEWKQVVAADEVVHGAKNAKCNGIQCEGCDLKRCEGY